MNQTIVVDQNVSENNTTRLRYGGGILSLSISVLFVIMMLYAYEPFTSGRVEWHLFLKILPAIPNEIMIGLWWAGVAFAVFGVFLSLMPAVSVILDDEKIIAQSIYTRKFKTIYFRDILDVVYNKNYINITDRRNNKIYLAKLFLSSAGFRHISDKLRSSARNAA